MEKNMSINWAKNKRVIIFVVIIVLCIVMTAVAIYFNIKSLEKKYEENTKNNLNINNNVEKEEGLDNADNTEKDTKRVDNSDKKYVCKKDETYDINDIDCQKMYIVGGNEYTEEEYRYSSEAIPYIKISGLKNEEIQNSINKDIKDSIVSFVNSISGEKQVTTTLEGNFSNILSIAVCVYSSKNVESNYLTLNYNLNNGKKFDLGDVFIKSTPIKMLLTEAVYERIAWNIKGEFASEEWEKNSDMNNRDTSNYEDILYNVSNIYNEKNGKLDFTVSPSEVKVYNLKIEGMSVSGLAKIDMYKYMEYIAIYKRFLSSSSLYKANDVSLKDVYTFTSPFVSTLKVSDNYIFGKKSNNLYLDFAKKTPTLADADALKKVYSSNGYKKVDEVIEKIKNEAANDTKNGYIHQGYIIAFNSEADSSRIASINLKIDDYVAKMPINDFKNNLQEYLNFADKAPSASIDGRSVGGCYFVKDKYKEITSETKTYTYYFDTNGNYLGDNEECIRKK